MAMERNTIVPLNELPDFEVADGDPDVRGWEVMSADGRRIGEVDQLLVDSEAMKVRYLDVDLDDEMSAGEARHVLIPIGYARLQEDSDRVVVDMLRSTDVAGLPAYRHEPVTRDFEEGIRGRFGGGAVDSDPYDDTRFYGARRGAQDEARITLSEEELRVGKGVREAGEVEVRKEVETEHVTRPVEVTREEVEIVRRPITDPMAARDARIQGDEIHVPLFEEEVVVEKRAVPKEEIVVHKRETVEHETVEADLRKERVDIEREGDARVRGDGLDRHR
jgi:uncharacterized protein (TIGR02271 family)